MFSSCFGYRLQLQVTFLAVCTVFITLEGISVRLLRHVTAWLLPDALYDFSSFICCFAITVTIYWCDWWWHFSRRWKPYHHESYHKSIFGGLDLYTVSDIEFGRRAFPPSLLFPFSFSISLCLSLSLTFRPCHHSCSFILFHFNTSRLLISSCFNI